MHFLLQLGITVEKISLSKNSRDRSRKWAYLCGSNGGDSSGNLGEREIWVGAWKKLRKTEGNEIYEGNLWEKWFPWKIMFTSKNENRKEIVFLFCFLFFSFLTLLYIQKDKKVSKEMCVSVIFNFFFFFRHGNRRRYDLKRRAFFFF